MDQPVRLQITEIHKIIWKKVVSHSIMFEQYENIAYGKEQIQFLDDKRSCK